MKSKLVKRYQKKMAPKKSDASDMPLDKQKPVMKRMVKPNC